MSEADAGQGAGNAAPQPSPGVHVSAPLHYSTTTSASGRKMIAARLPIMTMAATLSGS